MINERLRQSIEQLTNETATEWQSGYDAGIEAAAKALEDDAKTSGNLLWSEGQWHTYQIITSKRAAEIVRNLTDLKRPSP
jgi:hypothetical protein